MADKGLILLEPHILFLQALHLRQLQPPHPAEPLPPIAVGGVTDTYAATGRCDVISNSRLLLNLTQQLQYDFT